MRKLLAVIPNLRKLFLLVASMCLLAGAAIAALPAQAQREITHLLEFVQQSGCQFNRSGTWYTSQDARQHLQRKYDYLEKKGWVNSAEDFIERAASKSSVSGRAYRVQCASEKAVPSAQWLTTELLRYRKKESRQSVALLSRAGASMKRFNARFRAPATRRVASDGEPALTTRLPA